jgi:hypothetical protein
MTPGESADTNPTIPQDKYASLPTGELVLFAIQLLHADGPPATVEEIVSTCFKLFPHRFSLKNYFYWPDSALVVHVLTDAKEKKLIKESPADGFILRPAGRKVARQSAKAMGVRFPMPPKMEKPTVDDIVPVGYGPPKVEKQTADDIVPAGDRPQAVAKKKVKPAPVKKKVIKKKEAPKAVKKKSDTKKAQPEKKSKVTGASSLTPKAKPKAKKVVRKKKTVAKAVLPAKKKMAAKPKAQPKKTVSKPTPKVQAKKPISKPVPKKKAPASKKEKAPVKATVKKAQAVTQLPLPVPAIPKKEAKKPVVRKKVQPQVKQEAKPVVEKIPAVSKEEKVKAGKVIKQVERSDAYRQYKKLGRKAKISEFDFRDMLFATMESSAETLKRNVNLFKRYADIHSRADLIAFLDFTEGSFAPLLRSQAKQPARKR